MGKSTSQIFWCLHCLLFRPHELRRDGYQKILDWLVWGKEVMDSVGPLVTKNLTCSLPHFGSLLGLLLQVSSSPNHGSEELESSRKVAFAESLNGREIKAGEVWLNMFSPCQEEMVPTTLGYVKLIVFCTC